MPSRLLVVEDDERSRRLLVDVLGFHGYRIEAFASGEAALEHVRAGPPPDAALIDIQLPGMNGFALLSMLRQLPASPPLPVVAVTASVMDHDRRRIVAAGFDACVPKPVNMPELLATLRHLLQEASP